MSSRGMLPCGSSAQRSQRVRCRVTRPRAGITGVDGALWVLSPLRFGMPMKWLLPPDTQCRMGSQLSGMKMDMCTSTMPMATPTNGTQSTKRTRCELQLLMPLMSVYKKGTCIWVLVSRRTSQRWLPTPGASVAVNRWILDTGSGHDLVDEKQVSSISSIHYRKANATLQTAGGKVHVEWEVPMQVEELDEDIVPLVLKSTPAVLSLGKRCMQDGYAFEWLPHKTPTLTTPSGRRIDLVVEGNVPYLASVSPAVPVLCPKPAAGQKRRDVKIDAPNGEPWWDEGDVYAERPLGASSSSANLADEPVAPTKFNRLFSMQTRPAMSP